MPANTSVDARGLREFCQDGHPIFWWDIFKGQEVSEPIRASSGASYGICTEGNLWSQDAVYGRRDNGSRRLRESGHHPINTHSLFVIKGHWNGISRTSFIELTVQCRDGHFPNRYASDDIDIEGQLPKPKNGDNPEAVLENARAILERHGWTIGDGRVECPEHREERETYEAAFEAFKARHAVAVNA